MELESACHCGAVVAMFTTAIPLPHIEVRACQCSFCLSHGAKTVSDPGGNLVVNVAGAHAYRFGLKTADFWICNICGAYIAATMADGAKHYGVLNVTGARIRELAAREAKPVDYSGEDASVRNARRSARWTPAEIVR